MLMSMSKIGRYESDGRRLERRDKRDLRSRLERFHFDKSLDSEAHDAFSSRKVTSTGERVEAVVKFFGDQQMPRDWDRR